MTIPIITRTNTIDEWRIQTNLSAIDLNNLKANNYVKTNGTLELTNNSVLLISANGTALQVSNSAFIGKDLTVTNNVVIGTIRSNIGNVIIGNSLLVSGPGQALEVANTAYIGKNLSVVGVTYSNSAVINSNASIAQSLNVGSLLTLTGVGKVLDANNGTLYANAAFIGTGTFTTANAQLINALEGRIDNLPATGSAVIDVLRNTTGNIYYLTSNTMFANAAVIRDFVANNTGNIVSLTSNVATINTATIKNLIANSALIIDANVITLTANTSTLNNSSLINTNITNAAISNAVVSSAQITNSNTVNSNITNGTIINGNVVNLTSNNATLNNSSLINTTVTNAAISNAVVASATITNSNTTNSTITNGTIVNGNVISLTSNNATLNNSTLLKSNVVSLNASYVNVSSRMRVTDGADIVLDAGAGNSAITVVSGLTTLSGVVIDGNLTVSGTFTQTGNINFETDRFIFNANTPDNKNAFIINKRVSGNNAQIVWNELNNRWEISTGNTWTSTHKILDGADIYTGVDSTNDTLVASASAVRFAYEAGGVIAGGYANAAYRHANSSYIHANAAFVQANTPSQAANSAGFYANAAFTRANTANTNAATADQRAVTSGVYANSAYAQANTATTNAAIADQKAITAGDYANAAFAAANTAQVAGGVIAGFYANSAYDHANSAFDRANSAWAGTTGTHANAAYFTANAAVAAAAVADAKAVTANLNANTAFVHANAAFTFANTVNNYSHNAYAHANSAFAKANSAISGSGGSINGDLSITGSLSVGGATLINANELKIADGIITLNSDLLQTASPVENAGLEIDRGASPNVYFRWNETSDKWEFTNDGTTYQDLLGTSSITTQLANYLPLAGGTLTGALTLPSSVAGVNYPSSNLHAATKKYVDDKTAGIDLSNLNASNLTTGTVPSARLSGSYPISITGSAASATVADRARPRRSDNTNIDFFYSSQTGTPTYVWGTTDGVNMYVWSPSNFSVNYATSAGSATTATTAERARPRRSDNTNIDFYYNAQSGTPTYVWGTLDGVNMYVWSPSNFSVNYASTAGTASSATNATYASSAGTADRARPRRSDNTNIDFYYSGQGGQPTWLWGTNDGVNMYVWNPSNFNVSYAATAGSVSGGLTLSSFTGSNQSLAVGSGTVQGGGYQRLPGGLYLQWGYIGPFTGKGAGATITFPTTFPSTCAIVNATKATIGSPSGDKSDNFNVSSVSRSSFYFQSNYEQGSNIYYYIFAIGW